MYIVVEAKFIKPYEDEDGETKTKRVTEKYIIDAMTVTEAEAKFKGYAPNNWQELEVKGAIMMDLDDIIKKYPEDDENVEWFLVRVKFPEQGKKTIKWKSFQVMVDGRDLEDGLKNVIKAYSEGATADYKPSKIEESKLIVDEDLVPCKHLD